MIYADRIPCMHARMPMSMASRTGPLPPTLDLKRAAFSGMRVLLYTGDWSVYQSHQVELFNG